MTTEDHARERGTKEGAHAADEIDEAVDRGVVVHAVDFSDRRWKECVVTSSKNTVEDDESGEASRRCGWPEGKDREGREEALCTQWVVVFFFEDGGKDVR